MEQVGAVLPSAFHLCNFQCVAVPHWVVLEGMSAAPNEKIVQNRLNIALLNVF